MNIYMLRSAKDGSSPDKLRFRCGRFSYVAQKNILFSEKLPPDADGEVMLVSMTDAEEHITPAIYDECRKRGYSSVFLDTDKTPDDNNTRVIEKVSASLLRRAVKTFCPLSFANICRGSVPVAECAVSGGVLSDELKLLAERHKKIALSIPRIIAAFEMPVSLTDGKPISLRELSRLLKTFEPHVFFSPQMLVNYFLYSPSPDKYGFVLFDDANTMSRKLQLAKKLGFSDAFLMYHEVFDIAQDIRS